MFKKFQNQTNNKTAFIIITTLLIGGLMVSGSHYYQNYKQRLNEEHRTVIVATRSIEAKKVIELSDLARKEIALGDVNPLAVLDAGQIVGKATAVGVAEGEQITNNKIISTEMLIKPDERFVSVSVSKLTQCVGNTVQKGDYVDIYWVTSQDVPGYLIAPGVRVAELRSKDGQNISNVAPVTQGGITGAVQQGLSQPTPIPGEIVLVVKVEQVPLIARSAHGGLIYLSKISDINEARQFQQQILVNQQAQQAVKSPAS